MLLTPVAVYIGYFGAAAGVMLLAILSLGDHGDFRSVNVLKNLIGGAMGIVAATIFIVSGLVDWPHAIVMGIGGLIGGYTGGRMVRLDSGAADALPGHRRRLRDHRDLRTALLVRSNPNATVSSGGSKARLGTAQEQVGFAMKFRCDFYAPAPFADNERDDTLVALFALRFESSLFVYLEVNMRTT